MILILIVSSVKSDEKGEYKFSFNVNQTTENVEVNNVRNSFYSDDVAKLEALFEKQYKIINQNSNILSSEPAFIIRKPEIYHAINSIRKHLKRKVRKDRLSVGESEVVYIKVLEVANAIILEDTKEFEMALSSSSLEEKIEIFKSTNISYE